MGSKKMDAIALAFCIIGAINWGFVGLARINLVASILGAGTWSTRIVYVIMGISGIYLLSFFTRILKEK